jgi:hypothetical protein
MGEAAALLVDALHQKKKREEVLGGAAALAAVAAVIGGRTEQLACGALRAIEHGEWGSAELQLLEMAPVFKPSLGDAEWGVVLTDVDVQIDTAFRTMEERSAEAFLEGVRGVLACFSSLEAFASWQGALERRRELEALQAHVGRVPPLALGVLHAIQSLHAIARGGKELWKERCQAILKLLIRIASLAEDKLLEADLADLEQRLAEGQSAFEDSANLITDPALIHAVLRIRPLDETQWEALLDAADIELEKVFETDQARFAEEISALASVMPHFAPILERWTATTDWLLTLQTLNDDIRAAKNRAGWRRELKNLVHALRRAI